MSRLPACVSSCDVLLFEFPRFAHRAHWKAGSVWCVSTFTPTSSCDFTPLVVINISLIFSSKTHRRAHSLPERHGGGAIISIAATFCWVIQNGKRVDRPIDGSANQSRGVSMKWKCRHSYPCLGMLGKQHSAMDQNLELIVRLPYSFGCALRKPPKRWIIKDTLRSN